MKRRVGLLLGTVLMAALVGGGPAIARSVADFARNAGRLDGHKAVPSGSCPTPRPYPYSKPTCPERSRKLLVTNRDGFLADNVIQDAPDAAQLGGYGPERYVMECGDNAIAGFAQVPSDVGPDWAQVRGFGFTSASGGPVGEDGKPLIDSCSGTSAFAKRISTGVYQVAVYAHAGCNYQSPLPNSTIPAQVTVNDTRNLNATYVTVSCDQDKGPIEEVHIYDDAGSPTDASFTLTTFEPVRFLYP